MPRLWGRPGQPLHVVRSRAISPWRLQRSCASPPPVGGMPRIDSTLTLATRDEPARFGHLQSTLCAPSEPVGSPAPGHSLQQVVRSRHGGCSGIAMVAKAKKGRIRIIYPLLDSRDHPAAGFILTFVTYANKSRRDGRCSRGHKHVGAGSATKSCAGWSLQSPAGRSRTRVPSPNQPQVVD